MVQELLPKGPIYINQKACCVKKKKKEGSNENSLYFKMFKVKILQIVLNFFAMNNFLVETI